LLIGGTLFGLAGAWLAGTVMQTLLFDVPPLHMPILAASAAIMLLVTLAACLLPTHRAAGISPVVALSE
jgi:ABC-type antimicrobial peptide transport system permease subunit